MPEMDELLAIFDTELKRGTLTLIVLSELRKPQYGYSLIQNIAEKQVEIDAGTLYPMLRRLEKQGILLSDWDTAESRPRKYYKLSPTGEMLFVRLKENWGILSQNMNKILGEANEND